MKGHAHDLPIDSRGDRHLSAVRLASPNLPEPSCAVVAEQGARAARQGGRFPPSLLGQVQATNSEHPAMNGPQPPASDTVIDRAVRYPEAQQLGARKNSVLPARQPPCSRRIRRSVYGFLRYSDKNPSRTTDSPPFPSRGFLHALPSQPAGAVHAPSPQPVFALSLCRRWESNPHVPRDTAF